MILACSDRVQPVAILHGSEAAFGPVAVIRIADVDTPPVQRERFDGPARMEEEVDGVRELVLAISQSGETADTLSAGKQSCADRTVAVTNVVGCSLARECDDSLFVRAGPEISVAATKSFSSQIATLSVLCERIRRDVVGTGRSIDKPRNLAKSVTV